MKDSQRMVAAPLPDTDIEAQFLGGEAGGKSFETELFVQITGGPQGQLIQALERPLHGGTLDVQDSRLEADEDASLHEPEPTMRR